MVGELFDYLVLLWTSGSEQKLIFDHDRLIGLQKSIFRSDHRFSILYDRSFHFPTIDFSIFSLPIANKRSIIDQ